MSKKENNPDPLPKKGNTLFTYDTDGENNACLNFSDDMWQGYVQGYKMGAELIVQSLLENNIHIDFLIYPIGFLYRHYLELQLKNLIKNGNLLLKNSEEFPLHHDINKLWKECRPILEAVFQESHSQDFDAVAEYLEQYAQADPSSMAFRYPEGKNGEKSLNRITHINIRNLAEIMNHLSALLDGADMSIQVEHYRLNDAQ